jgi:hypothetical protein
MATIEQLYEGIRRAGAANDADAVRVLEAELSRMQSQQAQPAATQMPVERVGMLETPREFAGRPPEQVGATLGDLVPPPELAADLLKIKSPQGGQPTETNVQATYGQLERTGSIRDVLNKEVASGGLNPTATLDPQQYPVLAPIWEQYKKEMDPSMGGAFIRGAASQIGPVIGGALGGAALSPAGIIPGGQYAPIAGAIGGAVVGGLVQQGVESAFRSPQEQAAAQAQAAFDEARARGSRATGEFTAQLAALKPAVGTIQKALAGETKAIAEVALGTIAGTTIPLALGGGPERALLGGIGGGAFQPSQRVGQLMQRPLRTEAKAQQVASNIVQQYATEAGGIPEALAMRVEGAPSGLTGGGVTPLTSEISGNEGLISLGNALANMNAGLRQIRAESRAATAKNITDALRQRGASFEEAEQFLMQQRQRLLDDAQAASDAFIQSGDEAAATILNESIANAQAAKTAAGGVVQTAESMLEGAKQALETARAKISARRGVKNQSSETAKTVLNDKRKLEKDDVNKLYNDSKVAGLISKAQNTYQAALKARGPEGAGLWGDLPSPIQKIITSLTPPAKGAAPEVTVQDLMSGIRTLNGKIRASTDPTEQTLLTMVKDGMDADIQALGKVHSDLAVANAAYRSYASRYKDGPAKGVFNKFGGTEDSRTLDVFLNGPVERVRQLKDALKGDVKGTDAVQDWILNDLAETVKEGATPAKINEWLKDRTVSTWLQEFPEALPTIKAYLDEVTRASEAVSVTGGGVKAAKRAFGMISTEATEGARESAAAVKEAARRVAKREVQKSKEDAANSAAELVIGKSPTRAINTLMESDNPERAAKELIALASKDATGKATEGLQNAARKWINKEVTRFGEVVSTIDDPTATVSMDDLAKSYSKLNNMLVEGSDMRNAVKALLGNRELNMLDIYRGQMEVMERFRRASAGQSVTSLNTALKEQFNEKLSNNLLGFLGKIAYKTLPEGSRQGIVGATTRALAELLPNIVSGDPSGRARAIMIEAMTDKDLMAQLLRPLDKKNLPQAKAFIKPYLVPQGAETKQESQ